MGNLFTLCGTNRDAHVAERKERRQEQLDVESAAPTEADDKPMLRAMIQPVNTKPIHFEERGRGRFGM